MGCGWQAGWVMAKILLSNLHWHMMNKCWKFQDSTLILVWVMAEWLKICCNHWTPTAQMGPECASGVHWLQQIFSQSAITQTRIKLSSCNFQQFFIMCLCKFGKKVEPWLNQSASHGPFWPKLSTSLATVFVEIF